MKVFTQVSIRNEKFYLNLDENAFINLKNFLIAIGNKNDELSKTAQQGVFRYLDEEGDLVAVRDEVDFQSFQSCVCNLFRSFQNGGKVDKLEIYLDSAEKSAPLNLNISTDQQELCVEPSLSGGSSQMADVADFLGDFATRQEDFKQIGLLGHGHRAAVYKALNKRTDEIVALKCQSIDASNEVQQQILAELSVLHKCHSPFIIDFYGACFVDNQIAMATEYMNGGSLNKYGKLEEKLLHYVAVSVLHGLQYLWSLKIMHRDVKPSNILINTDGYIKLCDFGVSIQLVTSIAKSYVGTNAYMAPERLLGGEYRVHSDIWSLGVSLMEMAFGRFPFDDLDENQNSSLNPIELMSRIVTQESPKLSFVDFSADFCDFVNSCVCVDPNNRPTPATLSNYPLIVNNVPPDRIFIAQWLQTRLVLKNSTSSS